MLGRRFMFGRFVFDADRVTLFCEDTPVAVGHRGLALLHALLKANGQVVTKAELMDAAWPGAVVEESNLSVQIAALRKILGQVPDGTEWIATVPRIGYRFTAAVTADESAGRLPTQTEPRNSGLRPAVAVLPFGNLSDDAEQEYFADGITEDIIIAISRFRWFFVIARNSSFVFKGKDIDVKEVARKLDAHYVLEGSVRKSGRRVRITAQLIDAGSAHQLWADRYDVDLGEIFAVQDRIAEQVAGAIEPELLKTESTLAAKRRRAGNVNAWDIVLQGMWFFHQVTGATHLRARELFREARELDPELPEANLWLARVNAGLVAYGWTDNEEDDLREGLDAALRAVQIDERNPYAHYGLAIISVYSGALDRAIRAAEKALEVSPSFALGHLVLGMARLFSGSASEAIKPLEHGLRLNPYDPQNFVWYNVLALAHLFAADGHKARESAAQALKVRPNWRPTLETLACCHALLGDLHAARVCVEQIVTLDKPPGDVFGPLRRRSSRWAEELAALLRKAGMSEPMISRSSDRGRNR
jgi:TolB-like protein/Flp pilus assembly protein TadD